MLKCFKKKTAPGKSLLWHTLCVFFSGGHSARAASLAYASLLAFVPSLMICFWVLSWIPSFAGVAQHFQQWVVGSFLPESAIQISAHLTVFLGHLRYLTWESIVFLVCTVLFLLYNIKSAFNVIWHTKKSIHFTFEGLIYLFLVVSAPFLFAFIFILTNFISALSFFSSFFHLQVLSAVFYQIISYIITYFIFFICNFILPALRVQLVSALIGSLLTFLLFEMGRFGFSIYVHYAQTYQLIYGSLAVIPFFLLWLYYSWTVILMGAIATHRVQNLRT